MGLVNRSVALGSLFPTQGPLYHLEIQLHQAVVTELSASDNTIGQQRTSAMHGATILAALPIFTGLYAAIGAIVLVATWRSQWLTFGMHPERTRPHARFVILGASSSFSART